MAKLLIAVILLCGFVSFVSGLSSEQIQNMDSFIENLMELDCKHLGPGVSVVMVQDDEIVYNKVFGVSDIETGDSVTADHRFCVGSVTKSFTSTLLANLLTEHTQYDFDSPIQEMFGAEENLPGEMRTKYTTLKDLVSHRMGTQRFDVPWVFGAFLNSSRDDIMQQLHYLEEIYQFRTEYNYNNYYYMLAGQAAEALDGSGKTFEELLRERILEPLNMKSGVFLSPDLQEWEAVARPHVFTLDGKFAKLDEITVQVVDIVGPAGSLCLTMTDMANWLRFHLGNGSNPLDGSTLVDQKLFRDLHKEHQPLSGPVFMGPPDYPVTVNAYSYAMGFNSATYRGYWGQVHGGALIGYNTIMWGLPDRNAGIVIINNGPTDADNVIALHTAAFYGMDLLLDLEPWLNHSTACTFPEPWQDWNTFTQDGREKLEDLFQFPIPDPTYQASDEAKMRSFKLSTDFWSQGSLLVRDSQDYVGTYGNYFAGEVDITYDTQEESLHFKMGFGTGYLHQWADKDVFFIEFHGTCWYFSNSTLKMEAPIWFQRDSEDKVVSVTIPWMDSKWPVFVKDLPPATEPPATDPPATCGPDPTGSAPFMKSSFVLILLLFVLL